jgi:hypothetical protein
LQGFGACAQQSRSLGHTGGEGGLDYSDEAKMGEVFFFLVLCQCGAAKVKTQNILQIFLLEILPDIDAYESAFFTELVFFFTFAG